MTKQYDNTNRGAIWKRAPDANRNQPALRFQIERKEQRPQLEETPAAEQPKFDSSVDIPF